MTPSNTTPSKHPQPHLTLGFIGGGNMASAMIQGVMAQGTPAHQIHVQEPLASAREKLQSLGVQTWAQAGEFLSDCQVIVWAVKPQVFKTAAQAVHAQGHAQNALHLSVAAGIPSASISAWLHSERVVRAMPNTPALIGKGQTGLYAMPGVSASERGQVEQIILCTGQCLWVQDENLLNAVTALSGSGPAYVFYFIEAMSRAALALGLDAQQARQLAVGTFEGASALCLQSTEEVSTLRERVTSKGGTTQAALDTFDSLAVGQAIEKAMHAAHERAIALGLEFGA